MARDSDRNDRRDSPSGSVTSNPSFAFTQTVSAGSTFGGSQPSRSSNAPAARPADAPIMAASRNPAASPGRVVGVPQSLIEQGSSAGYSGRSIDQANGLVDSRPLAQPVKRNSKLSLKVGQGASPSRAVVTKEAMQVKSTSKASSPETARDFKNTCKPRPKDNKPKGGSGGKRGFIPWC